MHAPPAIVPAEDIARACLPLIQAANKPVLACWLGGVKVAGARLAFAEAKMAAYTAPERAVAGWLQRVHYARNQEALLQLPSAVLEDFKPDVERANALLEQALQSGREWLDEEQAKTVLGSYR